jgi:DNA-directed RNA polymerase specialized sigma24 family protein
VRLSTGYADDVDPHSHDQGTFRLINKRKELDELPGSEFVVPALDDWKYWTKMNDSRTACERAVERLPDRQRQVIQSRYFEAMTQEQIALASGIAASTVRNTHRGALANLRHDDELFDVLKAVGKVRDATRRQELVRQQKLRAA